MYFTYYGGKNGGDEANDIFVDSNNIAWIIGSTNSTDLESKPTKYQSTYNAGQSLGSAIFLINIDESGWIITPDVWLDGNGADNGQSITFDSMNNALITGNSLSDNFWNETVNINSNGTNPFGAFISKFDLKTNKLLMSSIIKMNFCSTIHCYLESQQILVNKDNRVYLLGNYKIYGVPINWQPIMLIISSVNDISPPEISIPGYNIGKTYGVGSNLTLKVTDDLSGVQSVFYQNPILYQSLRDPVRAY